MFEEFEVPSELKPSDPRFACGPSLVPEAHLKNLAQTGMKLMGTSHRQRPIKNLVGELQTGLSDYFQLPKDYLVVLGDGGATCFFDIVGLGLVRKLSAHFTCGEFSQKWLKAHQAIPWIETQEYKIEFGQGITPHFIPQADLHCMTLNETSTGVQIDELPKLEGDSLLAVDATSGAGQVPCDVSQTDVFFFSPQKVFASDGGLWVAIMSPKAIERAEEILKEKRYIPEFMRLGYAIENSRKQQTYTTPAVATLFLLNEQIKKMNLLGYTKVQQLAQEKAHLLYTWAKEKDYLSCYVKEAKYRSTAVATIDVDDRVPVEGLIKRLEDLGVVNGIGAYRKLGRNQFRIALFHNIALEDLRKLTQILSLAIESKL